MSDQTKKRLKYPSREIVERFLGFSDFSYVENIFRNWNESEPSKLYPPNSFFSLNTAKEEIVWAPDWLLNYIKHPNFMAECFGVDLPLLVDNGKPQIIAVFGLNPLRHENDWKEANGKWSPKNSFILSSAWGRHCGYVQGQNKQLLESLEAGYNVYLSDIQKWFFKDGGCPSQKKKDYSTLSIHKDIVNEEIKEIKPDYVLAIGAEAANVLGLNSFGITNNPIKVVVKAAIKYIVIPHTSNAVRENQKKAYAQINQFTHCRGSLGKDYADLIKRCIDQLG